MFKPPVIRPAELADASSLAEVHVASWQVAYRGLIPDHVLDNLSVGHRTDRWRQRLLQNDLDTLVLELEGRTRGFATYGHTRDPDLVAARAGEIYAFYLDPLVWGRGYGVALGEETLEILGQRGFATAVLWVLQSNQRARRFYEKIGFLCDGVSKIDIEPDGTKFEQVRYWQPLTYPPT
ncbi:MAG TPA: GNAT family N-acetyltransferase [Anaerolineae bacterium]|nr:GNAT family N-acetyltransferase [Anaerolineae bacterium]HMR65091.1 GNAT family N-acetyltransferase [Anaerolineae bacterium]